MQALKDEFSKQLQAFGCDESLQKQIELLFDRLLLKCISFFNERNAVAILDENFVIVEIDAVFEEWFDILRLELIGEPFSHLFKGEMRTLIQTFLQELQSKGFLNQRNVALQLRGRHMLLDMQGERFKIGAKIYYVLTLKNKEFDPIGFQLGEIERNVSNLVLRIKSFEPLMRELLRIFINSSLFDFGWVGKVDRDVHRIVPIVVEGDKEIAGQIEGRSFPYSHFEHILDVLISRKDIVSESSTFEKYKRQIVFPIFQKWVFEESDEVAFMLVVYSKEKFTFRESHLSRLREVLYKINLAVTDIYLKEQANLIIATDTLTSLPNREIFMRDVEQLLQEKIPFALVIVDVDRLRKVNQVMGFWAGDVVLQKLAAFLRQKLPHAVVARIGADEFGLVLKGDKKRIYESLDTLLSFNEQLVAVDGNELYISISLGVSFYPEDGKKKEELIFLAENALLQAKRRGGKRLEYAKKSVSFLPKDYLILEKELKEAIHKEEYILHHQPIIDIQRGRVWGVEALVRWNSRTRGLVPPGQFIPILEESGLINDVGDLVIKSVCKTAKEFEKYDLKFSFSMNLSVIQLLSLDVAQEIIDYAKLYQVKMDNLIVEITESVLMENLDSIMEQIHKLRQHGIRIEIDDFGTGYSSLSYLKRLPITALKIDRSFIHDLLTSKEGYSIVNAIISLAKALDKETIAEGVETREQVEMLRDMGVDHIQGFFFAKPMPKEELRSYVESFDLNHYL